MNEERERRANRVLLLDDHPVVRQGLAGLLHDHGFEVVGAVATVEEALALQARAPADFVVVDLALEHGSGFDVLVALRSASPGAVAIVYSVHEDGDRVARALEAGAMGYVTKREDPEVIVQCLRHVQSGERFLSPRAARVMADAAAAKPAIRPEDVLSPQEIQVYGLVGRGLAVQQIAQRLGLSVRTVESYLARMLVKLDLPGRRELRPHATEWAHRAGER